MDGSPGRSARVRRALARLLLYGGALALGLPLALSQQLVRPPRQPVLPPPPGYTETQVVSEGLRLRVWLRPGAAERPVVVLAHGLGDSISGVVDVADVLAGSGYSTLLVDLRAHGGSEGNATTLGGREREDVRAAMAEAERRGLARHGQVLMGWSMGAVAALRAAADRDDVRAVVVEAPYDTYRDTVRHHARLLYGLPGWFPLIPLTVAVAEWRGGFVADEVDAVAAARRVRAPLLAIVDGADPRMPEGVVRRVFDAHPGPKELWVAPGADHVSARSQAGYWPRVLGFLRRFAA